MPAFALNLFSLPNITTIKLSRYLLELFYVKGNYIVFCVAINNALPMYLTFTIFMPKQLSFISKNIVRVCLPQL